MNEDLIRDPYEDGLIDKDPFSKVASIKFKIVAVLDISFENRRMDLMDTFSRSIVKNSVVEFALTSEKNIRPGKIVDSVQYIGFGAAQMSGQATVGRKVSIEGHYIGTVLGFNDTHSPNHLNVVIGNESRYGIKYLNEKELKLGDLLNIKSHP